MSLINHNPGELFDGRKSIYAYTGKSFQRHNTIWGSWQDLNELTTYSEFVTHVGLHQEIETMRPGDLVQFTGWYLLIEGNKYYQIILYTFDKTLSPVGDPINAYIINPLNTEFIKENPVRPYDVFYTDIVKNLNAIYQMYMNLQVASKYIEDTINMITPIKGNNTGGEKQGNIIDNLDIIYTKLPKATIDKFSRLMVNFFTYYEELTRRSGVGNIVREIPTKTATVSFINYYSYIMVALEHAWGTGILNFRGLIKSFYYKDPEEAFRTGWYDNLSFLNAQKVLSLEVLSELNLTAPIQKTDWITSIQATDGKYNIFGVDKYYENLLSLQEIEEGFGRPILSTTEVSSRATTTAKIRTKILADFSEKIHEIGIIYSTEESSLVFTEARSYLAISEYNGFTVGENVGRIKIIETEKQIIKNVDYVFNIIELLQNTNYYLKPYIILESTSSTGLDGYRYLMLEGIEFSTDLSVPLTPVILPGLNAIASDRTQTSAKVTVSVGTQYSGAITERGILLSTVNPIPVFDDNNPELSGYNNTKYKTSSQSEDEYVALLSPLGWKSKYYARPYMVQYPTPESEPVIIYGDTIIFRTKPDASLPFISVTGKKSATLESIDIQVSCSLSFDAEENTYVYYSVQDQSAPIPKEVPGNAKYIGMKDSTISSNVVVLNNKVSIAGLAKGLYRIVIYGKNSTGIGYNSLKFSMGINSDAVTADSIMMDVTTEAVPEATVTATIVDNSYVKLDAVITKPGSVFEWAKLKVLSEDKTTTLFEKDIVAVLNELRQMVEYELRNVRVSALAANTSFVAQVSVKTSFIAQPALFEQTFTTPTTWNTANLFKPINPIISKSVITDSSDIRVTVNVAYPEYIEAGGKMILCIYDLTSMNGQVPTLSNYTEKKEITATKGQSTFIYNWNFTKPLQYMLKAYYVDTDTRVYESVYVLHTVELADVVAFTKYRIFYNLNGAEGTISPTEGSPNSTVFITPEIPVREGYTFGGWNTAQYGSGTSYASGNSIAIASSDIMLYAQWISSKVTVIFDTVGGSSISSQLINKGSKCTQPAINPTRTGYVFSHWYESNGNMSARFDFNTPIQANKTLYALWISEQASWGVVFDTKGGGLISTQTVLHNQKATKPTNPTRAGYYFVAWYKDEAYQNEYDFNTPVTGAIILYAKWSQSKFTVTFNSNGGTAVVSQEVAAGGLVQRPAKPTKADKYFVDWAITSSEDYNVDTVLYDFNTPVTANITLYACWATLTGTVVFEYNILKYTDANVKISQERYVAEGLIAGERVISKNSYETPPAVPTLDGYIFDGWYYINNENPTNGENAPETLNWGINMLPFDFTQRVVLEYGITLFTKWKKGTISHTVSFNTGTGATVINSQKVINGGFVIKPATPSREGYTFKHWYVSGDNTQTAYNFSTPVTAGLILVALWLPNYTGTTKQVTFNTNGGSAIATKEVASGGICTKPTDPIKSNYKFIDWYTDIELTESFDFNTVITEDITLYAKWEVIVVDKEIFNPPADAVPGQKYYFYDRIWVRDATDNRWRLDYKAMYEEMQSATNPVEKAKVRILSQNVTDYKQEISSLQEQVETLDKKNTEALQMTFNLLNENQNVVNNLNALYDTHIINLKRGQYLTDALDYINQVGDATAENPYTINFYNHSKTINLAKYSKLIHWPANVYLNFIGDINWGDFTEVGSIGFDTDTYQKLFIGFSFEKLTLQKSGLPVNMANTFFGYVDTAEHEYPDYETLLLNIGSLYTNNYGIVWVDGDRANDVRNSRLYLIRHGESAFEITSNFSFCDLSNINFSGIEIYGAQMTICNLENANLYGSKIIHTNLSGSNMRNTNLRKSDLYRTNLQDINFSYADLSYANLQGATLNYSIFKGTNLTGVSGLPEDMNTKVEFIAVVGAGNVDASTIWIDGTSILA